MRICLWTAALVITVLTLGQAIAAPGTEKDIDELRQQPVASAGADRVVRVGEPVEFCGTGASPDDEIIEYAWDFESDGRTDFVSAETGFTTHRFSAVGDYRCVLTVRDSCGRVARDSRRIVVVAEKMDTEAARQMLHPLKLVVGKAADGVKRRYAIMISGANEARFWTDVELGYDMLVNRYGFAPGDVYLLNYNGTNPQGTNPGGMIDRAATKPNLDAVFAELAVRADADDELFVWITGHGYGYSGPLSEGGAYLGYLDGRASVDPGDESDFRESNFKLRSLFTGGDFRCNHGLNVWKVRRKYTSGTKTEFYRNKFVSRLDNVYIEGLGTTVSDSDILIERLVDYALGDTNRDGYIDTGAGEVYDFDHDGKPPYDPATGQFDEGDWGEIDNLEDDYNNANTQMPVGGFPYKLFDEGFQGKLCIDLGYTGGPLHVDGRDEDNAGLFDWLDVNQDGDTDDIVSIDEAIQIYSGDLYDDDLRAYLDQIPVARVTVVAEPCFSGGFVWDLSSPTHVICTATIEDAVSWGNNFIRDFTAALHGRDQYGNSVSADANANGYVSMLEAFNYAAGRDHNDEIPQYDDNGDGISHTDPVPAGGDGDLGADTYLSDPQYRLLVVGGSGSGTYSRGTVVPIVAPVPDGYGFGKWTGDTANVADVSSPSTTVTMLADMTVVATLRLLADTNGDGCVNVADLLIVRNHLGTSGPSQADVNADGICNVADLLLVRNSLGQGICQ